MEEITKTKEPTTRTVLLMRQAGKRLGLTSPLIEQLINPQQVVIFRLPCSILGKVPVVWGCLSLHNNAKGPYKGGIRLTEDVDIWETVELSRLMTLKTAINEIEFGGGKTGIRVHWESMYKMFNKRPIDGEFEKIVSLDIIDTYAHQFKDIFSKHIYIPAPDMGTGPDEMALIYNETQDPASVTGKPEGLHGWLPGRKESTGYGCCYVVLWIMRNLLGIDPVNSKVAIQGFGNVSQPLAFYLTQHKVKIVGITDRYGGVYSQDGLDIEALIRYVHKKKTVKGFSSQTIDNNNLFNLPVDVLIPAACGQVITKKNAANLNAKAVVEAANMPITADSMAILERRKIVVIPDIIANSGGVIASMEEYASSLSAIKTSQDQVFQIIEQKISDSLRKTIQLSKEKKINLVESAVEIALQKVYQAMVSRRYI